ncbi:unnamed protein product [Darwinula stevensoni]|uniref:REST corepressor n=1 Tax=Darwinula stevensoni TaxID=69355 RepID=A0A7R8XDE2_9CRUS|nr:unnamed protein product [Darwinula stevensoni]CAG0886717.1 unnamed protein product [Darwinula stevensoni]
MLIPMERNSEHSRLIRKPNIVPTSNGHLTQAPTASSDDGHRGGMRVGRDYQAVVPPIIQANERKARLEASGERALLVWSPTTTVSDAELDRYIALAKEKYGYNPEQALGMLFWHRYDLKAAEGELPNFTPFPDEWSKEDRALFEQAFAFHGKSFNKIRQMLPEKSMASLVKHYYLWKKSRDRVSFIDRQVKRLSCNPKEEGDFHSDDDSSGSEGSGREGEGDESKNSCTNCGVTCNQVNSSPKGNLCGTCFTYWKQKGDLRPTVSSHRFRSSTSGHKHDKSQGRPYRLPRGMHINHDDLISIAVGVPNKGDAILKHMSDEITTYKRKREVPMFQVQGNKQILSSMKTKLLQQQQTLKTLEDSFEKVSSKWTNEDMAVLVKGIEMFGCDFKKLADLLGNKTEVMVRSVYGNCKKEPYIEAALQTFNAKNSETANNHVDGVRMSLPMSAMIGPSSLSFGHFPPFPVRRTPPLPGETPAERIRRMNRERQRRYRERRLAAVQELRSLAPQVSGSVNPSFHFPPPAVSTTSVLAYARPRLTIPLLGSGPCHRNKNQNEERQRRHSDRSSSASDLASESSNPAHHHPPHHLLDNEDGNCDGWEAMLVKTEMGEEEMEGVQMKSEKQQILSVPCGLEVKPIDCSMASRNSGERSEGTSEEEHLMMSPPRLPRLAFTAMAHHHPSIDLTWEELLGGNKVTKPQETRRPVVDRLLDFSRVNWGPVRTLTQVEGDSMCTESIQGGLDPDRRVWKYVRHLHGRVLETRYYIRHRDDIDRDHVCLCAFDLSLDGDEELWIYVDSTRDPPSKSGSTLSKHEGPGGYENQQPDSSESIG